MFDERLDTRRFHIRHQIETVDRLIQAKAFPHEQPAETAVTKATAHRGQFA
jgi:hypothetical protein